ncbi:MAG: ABC transporter permease [Acidobacteriota bacterium]
MRRDRGPSKVWVLAKREYLSRVKSKGFWIGTLILPVFMAAMFVIPGLILSRTTSGQQVVMVDETGRIADSVVDYLSRRADRRGDEQAEISLTTEAIAADRDGQRADLDRRVLAEEIDAWVWVSEESLADDAVEYHAESVSNLLTQGVIENAIESAVREMRLADAGLDPNQVGDLIRGVELQTLRVTEEGSREEAGESGFFLAYGMFFLLYIIFLLWGQQVLTGVLEEKSSRIVEVIVSTARPQQLMMGKLVGIALAGLTQLSVWLGTMMVATAPGIVASLAFLPEDFSIPVLTPAVALYFVLFFILGFFVYSSLYAAVGSAFNNLQEAQHLAAVPMMFIIMPFLVIFPVINDPDGALAVVSSLIPVFSPLLMPVRIAVKMPPFWQVGLSLVLTTAFVVFMTWLCGRIYRVGILMHGKKPTLAEIWRWVRYA